MASAMIGNLAVSLTMNTAAFARGASLAEKRATQMQGRFAGVTASVKGIGAALGGVFVADTLYNFAAGAFEMAASLSEAAERAGVTVEALQELRHAADAGGLSNEKLEASLVRLSRSVAQAANGSKPMLAALDALGLSIDDLAGKTPDQQFRILADAYANASDKAQALAAGQTLVGRGFSEVIPVISGGSAALDEHARKSREQGQISTEQAAKLDQLADTWGEFKTQVSIATANVIADVIPMAEKVGAALDATKAFFFNLNLAITRWYTDAVRTLQNFGSAVKEWLQDKVAGVFSWFRDRLSEIGAALRGLGLSGGAAGGRIRASFMDMADDFSDLGYRAEAVSVRVEKSFKDMADATLGALGRLSGAIQSGGFLGILEGVLGLGLQLGSIGAFGSKIATRINTPAGAGLTSAPRGSTGRGANIMVTPSPYFDVVVDTRIGAQAPAIMHGGAVVAQRRAARTSTRRLA